MGKMTLLHWSGKGQPMTTQEWVKIHEKGQKKRKTGTK